MVLGSTGKIESYKEKEKIKRTIRDIQVLENRQIYLSCCHPTYSETHCTTQSSEVPPYPLSPGKVHEVYPCYHKDYPPFPTTSSLPPCEPAYCSLCPTISCLLQEYSSRECSCTCCETCYSSYRPVFSDNSSDSTSTALSGYLRLKENGCKSNSVVDSKSCYIKPCSKVSCKLQERATQNGNNPKVVIELPPKNKNKNCVLTSCSQIRLKDYKSKSTGCSPIIIKNCESISSRESSNSSWYLKTGEFELRGGKLIKCICKRSDGLQDRCPRTGCQGSSACMAFPPRCDPSQFDSTFIGRKCCVPTSCRKHITPSLLNCNRSRSCQTIVVEQKVDLSQDDVEMKSKETDCRQVVHSVGCGSCTQILS